ncbi:uracil-DNA glycosylase family protein [Lentilactobacillus senioris]|uniref:uracil-DNA glycosylase family protein n=1 Tax=Lentilactobacillus senioris TaxID=931534 RepID=UPI002282ED40|nr:uracil-DNA glycosylase family protein [Lentilactobacillus senioris]MCY9807375.1 uracil-DNA glycosylase family protein [Lentilactobacillus senioris]
MTDAEIFAAIQADPQNAEYTSQNIPPIYQVDPQAEILIISQAPSKKVQETQIFWNDQSGDRLRQWMNLSREEFYQTNKIAVLPLDFYFPGKGIHGDLPPRKGFAEKWHAPLLELMPNVKLTLLIGAYAQKFYLQKRAQKNLTETVRHYQEYLPQYFPIVHPSPLNYGWFKKNPWFEAQVVPDLQRRVAEIMEK